MLAFPVFLLWLCTFTVALPTADFTHTTVHQYDKRATKCYSLARKETVDINLNDCVNAINDMPTTQTLGLVTNAVQGNFGNTVAQGSPFKLPRHFAQGNCMIGVTMTPAGLARKDEASWNEIANNAAGIVRQCLIVPPPARRGGSDTAGVHNLIQIDVFKYAPHLHFLLPLNDFMDPAWFLRAHASH